MFGNNDLEVISVLLPVRIIVPEPDGSKRRNVKPVRVVVGMKRDADLLQIIGALYPGSSFANFLNRRQ